MIEALMGVTVTSIAGAALLISLGAAVHSSTEAAHHAIARGLADQLMDEIAGVRFPRETDIRPSGGSREEFDDIDDYQGWSARPPVDRRGRPLGTESRSTSGEDFPRPAQMRPAREFLDRLTRQVQVEESGRRRRVTVRVMYTDPHSRVRTLAEISRTFSYAPITP